ncbi:MAG: alpha-L-glutamate ligase-like protein [Pseudomonadota bacterium]
MIEWLKKYLHLNMAAQGIVGINKRNISYILAHNERKFYPLVDNKILTKELAEKASIPTPKLLGKIEYHSQIYSTLQNIDCEKGFVIKPAQGSGGGGIMVITRKEGDNFFKAEGNPIDIKEMHYYVSNVLAGLYSLGGIRDTAMIEERIICHNMFDKIAYKGVPDLRIILFHGYPIMAMLRLPTRQSDGKANLHSGGLGVGLDIATGKTTYAMQDGQYITHHPDYDTELSALKIPNWRQTLEIIAGFRDIIPLKYLGIDMVVDQEKGASLLEANARPGIAIQIANKCGLEPRLKMISKLVENGYIHNTPEERVEFVMASLEANQ